MIKYTTFSFGYLHLSLLFFIFNNATIDSILFLAMAESNPPTTEEELKVKNEFPAAGEKKQQGKTSLFFNFLLFVN